VLVSKYGVHQPLYPSAQIMSRSRSDLWVCWTYVNAKRSPAVMIKTMMVEISNGRTSQKEDLGVARSAPDHDDCHAKA
jgi:hypothetical protein